MPGTKIVGASGKYGARYGRKIKKKVVAVSKMRKAKHTCSKCLKPGVKRISSGIWFCNKCGSKFAGKAYKPE